MFRCSSIHYDGPEFGEYIIQFSVRELVTWYEGRCPYFKIFIYGLLVLLGFIPFLLSLPTVNRVTSYYPVRLTFWGQSITDVQWFFLDLVPSVCVYLYPRSCNCMYSFLLVHVLSFSPLLAPFDFVYGVPFFRYESTHIHQVYNGLDT